MSEFFSISEDVAYQSIATAVAAGVDAHPDVAAAKVIDRLPSKRFWARPSCDPISTGIACWKVAASRGLSR